MIKRLSKTALPWATLGLLLPLVTVVVLMAKPAEAG